MIRIIHGNALDLPIEDNTVDLVVTSPPYFGLRSYQDGCPDCADSARAGARGYMERYCPKCSRTFASGRNKCHVCDVTTLRTQATKDATAATDCATCGGTGKGHYSGQIGSEATPAEFVDALIAATREMVRVLKPSGSIWVNLGDRYAGGGGTWAGSDTGDLYARAGQVSTGGKTYGLRPKSLIGIPWRYALRCIDELGLILRAEVIWSKPNGLPESVTDRVRRSHEQWFHFTVRPRYYSAVDEVREEHAPASMARYASGFGQTKYSAELDKRYKSETVEPNPLGKLPGSVWTIPTQPLTVPAHLGIDHFAAFPMEFPRRIITGWSPREVCSVCGEGRRPVVDKQLEVNHIQRRTRGRQDLHDDGSGRKAESSFGITERSVVGSYRTTVTGYACACPNTTAPTTPGLVLDSFGGTGTVGLVADVLGRDAIHVDLSADYCRLAEWRTTDPGERARAMKVEKPEPAIDGQMNLWEGLGA